MSDATIHVGGMTCYGCVTKISKHLRRTDGRIVFQAFLPSDRCTVTLPEGVSVTKVRQLIESLGFTTNLTPGDGSWPLIRLGVAWFCFGNVMMFATSVYLSGSGGITPGLHRFMDITSMALTGFALSYAGRDILWNAWQATRHGRPSVDLPIALGATTAFIFSVTQTLGGGHQVYYDSVTAILAFVLTGRYVLNSYISKSQTTSFALKVVCRRKDGSQIALHEVKKDDHLIVPPGGWVPVRSSLVCGDAELSYEPITGEPAIKLVTKGQSVEAGAIASGRPLTIQALEDGRDSKLQKIFATSMRLFAEKTQWSKQTDQVAAVFYGLVVMIAAGTFLLTQGSLGTGEAVSRTVAILLVACPCAFAFVVPLLSAKAVTLAGTRGVQFRSGRALEALGTARRILFDKTGTLTLGNLRVTHAHVTDPKVPAVIKASAKLNDHGIASALSAWADNEHVGAEPEISDFEEIPGRGVSFRTSDGLYRLGRAEFVGTDNTSDSVYLTLDGQLIASFELRDTLHADSGPTIEWLKKHGYHLGILSGDKGPAVEAVSRALGLEQARSALSPQDKLEAAGAGTVMVGNGFNDALAISGAAVGVAVAGSQGAASALADVTLSSKGIGALVDAICVARYTRLRLIWAFTFTSIYNLALVTMAVLGWVSPVVAAVLMPINSACVALVAVAWWRL